ncbi:hypothetical protein HWV62_43068 [Athelia sp. TMB]|nr:hypothetical protein HWV62_43068 [Athelia sp. TMB]
MISLLIINPNSTKAMTDGLKPLVANLGFANTCYTWFTAPSGPASINNEEHAKESVQHCLPHLLPLLDEHDGFLVACYSDHPLVDRLSEHTRKPVVGIFQASITASLQLIKRDETFGIISTGAIWERLLTAGVHSFLGVPGQTHDDSRATPFAGVETTGLNATDLHNAPASEVRQRIKEATLRLLDRNRHGALGAICLGCAGMAGMEDIVREACFEKLGHSDHPASVRVVDGVKAGVGILVALVAANF